MDTISNQDTLTEKLQNPFPGLRPFHPNEAHLFFGREGQSEEILENLAKNRFAAVLGASGSGKSSLIYCGLLPTLYGGFLHNGRSKWRIAISRPGSDPTANLARSIAKAFKEGSQKDDFEADTFINQAVLRRSSSGISNVINQYKLGKDENFLILVDQFEELFRYQYSGKDSDALDKVDHFINLLVNIVKQQELPVYLVITMRSDFIGDCSPFQQFTRLINDSHYLIPRMTREDFRKAITGPVSVGGGEISDQLVQLLLNEMGNNPDHLPILQHALMRTWEHWVNHSDRSFPMGITEYEAIGRLERALSNHANDAFYELNVEQKRTCEVVFKSLTEKGADNRGIRRPTTAKELAAIAETTVGEVIRVVEVFRMKGRTFLTPSPEVELNENSVVDISHESLMRVWDKLKIWVDEE
ncbi:MAG: High-affnity carbon uptake protein Hat/HatR, partial [Bacteroidetes bacterium HGW-Bacteroidetes-15]